MVSSRVYPGLERKPGGPDNWVEAAGGLPSYIERIAKHLHYEKGFSISRAIATAVNTVRRWMRGGTVTKHGTTKRVSAKTIAQAAAAYASWQAKKRIGSLAMSESLLEVIDLTEVGDDLAYDLLVWMETGVDPQASADQSSHAILAPTNFNLAESLMNPAKLLDRAGAIEDPERMEAAVQRILNLAVPASELTAEKRRRAAARGAAMADGSYPITDARSLRSAVRLCGRSKDHSTSAVKRHIMRRARALGLTSLLPDQWTTDLAEVLELASSIAPRGGSKGKATDGRPSYKKQGKWGHGFVPLDAAAKEAKAKGSPIAMKRMNRLFGGKQAGRVHKPSVTGRAGGRSAKGLNKQNPVKVRVDERTRPGAEEVSTLGQLRQSGVDQATNVAERQLPKKQQEISKSSRVPARARQNWDEIPDHLKTLRNGKRYVLAEFQGRGFVTPWLGGVNRTESEPLSKRKVMRSITAEDVKELTPSALGAMLKNPKVGPLVKKAIQKEIYRRKVQKAAHK